MYLDRLEFSGYRNLEGEIHLSHPLAVLVGPNNAGKSNVVDALRILLTPLVGWPLRSKREDFAHSGLGIPQADKFSISAYFGGLTLQQGGRFITAIDGARDRASLHLEATLTSVGSPKTRLLGGTDRSPDVEEWARTGVTYTYLPPLRDAEEDLRAGRNSRLVELISALTGDGTDREDILAIAGEANASLESVPAITKSMDRIQKRLDSVSGAGHAQAAQLLVVG